MAIDAASRSGSAPAARELLIDTQLPRFDVRGFSAVVVDAMPEVTYHAIRSLDPQQVGQAVPVMQLMGWMRALPARVGPRRHAHAGPAPEALSPEQYEDAFVPVAEQPGTEFVIGLIGKFSSPSELEFRRFQPDGFAGFAEPGFGKVAVGFLVLPYGAGRSLLCTETRTATTDPGTARRFRRYWTVIGPFAGYIMRHWLTLAKQHAEQGSPSPTRVRSAGASGRGANGRAGRRPGHWRVLGAEVQWWGGQLQRARVRVAERRHPRGPGQDSESQ